jgi:hypothetical protein
MNNIVEDWYSIDNDKDKSKSIDTESIKKYIDEKFLQLENKIEHKLEHKLDQLFKVLTHKEIENKKIQELLYELKNLKEREINVMIREKIPFPFGLPKSQSSPLHQTFLRLPKINL